VLATLSLFTTNSSLRFLTPGFGAAVLALVKDVALTRYLAANLFAPSERGGSFAQKAEQGRQPLKNTGFGGLKFVKL
jgi:hypothetical protein